MKNKICIIFCCMMLVIISVFPMNVISEKTISDTKIKQVPIPGNMEGNEPIIKVEHEKRITDIVNPVMVSSKNVAVAELLEQIDEQMIYDYIYNITGFGPRITGQPACEQAATYIYNEFEKMGLDVRYDDWEYNDYISNNIEATLNGTDQTSDEIYIVCGHYDSVSVSPGADDDASGVAVALATAYVMSQYTFNHTVRFIAFSGEEEGLLGSYMYVQDVIENGDNIVGVLNADMIGFATTEYDGDYLNIYEDDESMWLFDFTNNVNQLYSDYIDLTLIPTGFSWGSDHYYFWEFGYSALFYAEYNFNDYYHSEEDTLDNMNMTYDVKGTRLILATLAELAQLSSSNLPPSKPTITGPLKGKPKIDYDYNFVSTDPEGNDIYYSVDWGDGSDILYIGPNESGQVVTLNHTWAENGTYIIKAKAKDIYGAESDWAIFSVTMPKNNAINSSILNFLQNFIQNHPNLFSILQVIVQRLGL